MAASQALRQAREGRGSPTVSLAWGRGGACGKILVSDPVLCCLPFTCIKNTAGADTHIPCFKNPLKKNKRVGIGDTVPFLFQGYDFSCAFSPIEEELGEGIRKKCYWTQDTKLTPPWLLSWLAFPGLDLQGGKALSRRIQDAPS